MTVEFLYVFLKKKYFFSYTNRRHFFPDINTVGLPVINEENETSSVTVQLMNGHVGKLILTYDITLTYFCREDAESKWWNKKTSGI